MTWVYASFSSHRRCSCSWRRTARRCSRPRATMTAMHASTPTTIRIKSFTGHRPAPIAPLKPRGAARSRPRPALSHEGAPTGSSVVSPEGVTSCRDGSTISNESNICTMGERRGAPRRAVDPDAAAHRMGGLRTVLCGGPTFSVSSIRSAVPSGPVGHRPAHCGRSWFGLVRTVAVLLCCTPQPLAIAVAIMYATSRP